ncbi:MAG TPA: BamA/TamA family outer membrane protein [Casimicrobiaceae bacterium]|nr:BamA/TamA family outer membrane protein [Casimicrobiaceae bacterium]
MHRLLPFLLACLTLCATPAVAQDATEEAPASAGFRYKLVVDAPNPPREALAEGLDLARWQADEAMTLDLLERLARESVAQAREIAAVHGFYDAQATVAIDRDARPVIVTLKVTPGPATRVRSVRIDVDGPATTDQPLGTQAIDEARDGWRLKLGEVFRQADWVGAKAQALRELQRSPYAAARIVTSQARVDPDAQAADLELRIDSGPPFRIGGLAIQGLKRYSPELVANFSTIEPGEPYTEAIVDQYVRRLSATGYFSSVQASIDPQTAHPEDATLDVAVIEGPTHRLEGALSFSTDTGFGARVGYTNVNLDDAGLQMRLDGRLETKQQLARSTFTWPPTARHWIDSLQVGAERTDIENTTETNATVQVERRGIDERNHPVYTASFVADREEPQGAEPTDSHATFVQAGYVLRRVDDLLSPTRGYMVDARAGGGIPGISTRGFGRVHVQAAAWWPIDRMTQLAFRGEAGAVIASRRDGIPSVFLFRTGGDTTVRGYAYQSLGLPRGDAVVGGRYLAIASAEAIRWINETWGVAAFVDVGDAFDDTGGFDPAVGVGLGARLRTPIGPFRLDVAYGERTKEVRLHFSVGVTF